MQLFVSHTVLANSEKHSRHMPPVPGIVKRLHSLPVFLVLQVMYRGAPLMDVCEKFNRKQGQVSLHLLTHPLQHNVLQCHSYILPLIVSSFHQMKKVEREKRCVSIHECYICWFGGL